MFQWVARQCLRRLAWPIMRCSTIFSVFVCVPCAFLVSLLHMDHWSDANKWMNEWIYRHHPYCGRRANRFLGTGQRLNTNRRTGRRDSTHRVAGARARGDGCDRTERPTAAAQFATPSHRRPLTHGPIMSRPARRASPTSRHPVLRPPSALIPSPRSSVVRRSYRIVARITRPVLEFYTPWNFSAKRLNLYRDFKLCGRVDHLKYQPWYDKLSPKWTWSRSRGPLKNFGPPKIAARRLELKTGSVGRASYVTGSRGPTDATLVPQRRRTVWHLAHQGRDVTTTRRKWRRIWAVLSSESKWDVNRVPPAKTNPCWCNADC